jgi:CheY-like chemotaxis protein
MPLRVLVVDDNEANRLVACALLRHLGYDASAADDGAQAVERCLDQQPDAVLMDIAMPRMDGHTATRELRRLQSAGVLRTFPIIAATACCTPDDRAASQACGIDGFLTKPLELGRLKSQISALVGGCAT